VRNSEAPFNPNKINSLLIAHYIAERVSDRCMYWCMLAQTPAADTIGSVVTSGARCMCLAVIEIVLWPANSWIYFIDVPTIAHSCKQQRRTNVYQSRLGIAESRISYSLFLSGETTARPLENCRRPALGFARKG
jgi:hypothetical protein